MIKVKYVDHMGSDLTTVNSARVSYGKHKDKFDEKDTRLVHYLGSHNHISPFGHSFASFHVKAPVFVARQLVKHKFLRWNEISRRYVDDEPEFYMPEEWRGRPVDSKQGSDGVVETTITPKYVYDTSRLVYKNLLAEGVAPEQARMVLPQGMMTEWYWSGSLDAFADMCNLRCKPDTQYESRIVADRIDYLMGELFPVSWEALRDEVHT